MQILNAQAQLFMVAAICMLTGIGALYVALGLYGMLINKALRWFGVHAALFEYIAKNRTRWWGRVATWFDGTFWGQRNG
jgi:hypothetical protein